MSAAAVIGKTFGFGRKTATADTKYNVLCPPMQRKKTKVTGFSVTVSTTAHTLTILAPLATTTLSAAAAAAQAVIVLTADPGDYSSPTRTADNLIAASDYLVMKCPDGTFIVDTVSSVSGLSITMTTSLPTGGLASGAQVWFYGINTDTNPRTALAHPIFTLAASSTVTRLTREGSVAESPGSYEPLIIQVNNATVASVLEWLEGCYGN